MHYRMNLKGKSAFRCKLSGLLPGLGGMCFALSRYCSGEPTTGKAVPSADAVTATACGTWPSFVRLGIGTGFVEGRGWAVCLSAFARGLKGLDGPLLGSGLMRLPGSV